MAEAKTNMNADQPKENPFQPQSTTVSTNDKEAGKAPATDVGKTASVPDKSAQTAKLPESKQPVTHADLLKNSMQILAQVKADPEAKPQLPESHDSLVEGLQPEDPFGGNINNLRVAQRIANSKPQQYRNTAVDNKVIDPEKAAQDVQAAQNAQSGILERQQREGLEAETSVQNADKANTGKPMWKANV